VQPRIVAQQSNEGDLLGLVAGSTSTLPLDDREIVDLTTVIVDVDGRMKWRSALVVDKHCVGSLPDNRTTPIVVAIATANGLVMPTTSSRAITAPADTAGTMEKLTVGEGGALALRTIDDGRAWAIPSTSANPCCICMPKLMPCWIMLWPTRGRPAAFSRSSLRRSSV
jgi:hypothetical protein